MSAEAVEPRPYVPGLGAFLSVLMFVGFVASYIDPDPYFSDNSASRLGAALGTAITGAIVGAPLGLFTFWKHNPAWDLWSKVIAPAVLYGLIAGLVAVGQIPDPRPLEPGKVFSTMGWAFSACAGAPILLLYLVQFAGRLLARRQRAA